MICGEWKWRTYNLRAGSTFILIVWFITYCNTDKSCCTRVAFVDDIWSRSPYPSKLGICFALFWSLDNRDLFWKWTVLWLLGNLCNSQIISVLQLDTRANEAEYQKCVSIDGKIRRPVLVTWRKGGQLVFMETVAMMVPRIKLIYIRIQICGLKYLYKMHSRYAKVRKFIFAVLTD